MRRKIKDKGNPNREMEERKKEERARRNMV